MFKESKWDQSCSLKLHWREKAIVTPNPMMIKVATVEVGDEGSVWEWENDQTEADALL